MSELEPFVDGFLELLNLWQATVIKGNAAEIGALAKSEEVCINTICYVDVRDSICLLSVS